MSGTPPPTGGEVPWPAPPANLGPWGGSAPIAPDPASSPAAPGPVAGSPQPSGTTPGPGGAPPSVPPPPGLPHPGAAGFPGGQYPGVPPAPAPRSSRLGWVLIGLLVLALVGGAAYYFVIREDGRFHSLIGDTGPDHPEVWDPRVSEIATWLEKDRKLDFDHPVEVLFLTAEEYTAEITGAAEDEGEEESTMNEGVGVLRALGFIHGDPDLDAASETLMDTGSLAFYRPDTKKVYVRGTELTPAVRVTVAHELAHALQDQHFDLSRTSDPDFAEASVLRALAEGDAGAVEERFAADQLTGAERTEYEEQSAKEAEDAMEVLGEEVPPILTTFMSAPYAFGPALIATLDAEDGQDAIDAALLEPPSEEALWDPRLLGSEALAPREVTAELPADATEVERSPFGPISLFLLLANRIEAAEAMVATDGWGGDEFLHYTREDGLDCVALAVEMDTPEDLEELRSALEAWVDGAPEETASVGVADGRLSMWTCDPGEGAPAPEAEFAPEVLAVPVTRTMIVVTGLEQGIPEATAHCWAEAVATEFTVEDLSITDPNSPEMAALQQRMMELLTGCS